MPIDSVIHTNRYSIDRVLNAGLPLVLVFREGSAPQGRAAADEMDRLAAKYAGRALIADVDAREEEELLSRFQVSAAPAYIFVKDGQVMERTQVGDLGYVDAWLAHLTGNGRRPPAQTGKTPENARNSATTQDGAHNGSAGRSNGGAPITLTDATFVSQTSGDIPVLVDFWAEWCGPCRMVAPSIEQLAREFNGRALVAKLNVDENPASASRFGVMSIPTLIIFKNGAPVDRIVGAQSLPVLRQRLAAQTR